MMRVVFMSFITITELLDSCWKPSFEEELSFSIWCIDIDFSDITLGENESCFIGLRMFRVVGTEIE